MEDRRGDEGIRPRLGILLAIIASTAAITRAAEEKLVIPGLGEPVEILRDRWGIAHIYARNEHDLFLAQGFNAARDRLFQLELWRRRATGTLAEIQGPRALLRRHRRAAAASSGATWRRELNHYHPRGAEIVAAFVEGINAYIERTEREPARLPLEFRSPGDQAGQVDARGRGLAAQRAVSQRHPGGASTPSSSTSWGRTAPRELLNLHPGQPDSKPDAALDLSLISEALLETLHGLARPVRFRPEDVVPEFRAKARPASKPAIAAADPIDPALERPPRRRSRGGGEQQLGDLRRRTFSGGAIMANDPHRALQLPSLRYWVHLVAPGWNVIGAGEPALPGVSVGHNEHGAWGFTIFPIDQEDLYVYETDPADPSRYRYRGGWEAMRTIRETIAVEGRPRRSRSS